MLTWHMHIISSITTMIKNTMITRDASFTTTEPRLRVI
jgi:hypothetical protein